MRARVDQEGGHLEVRSVPGTGTTVSAEVPG
jgi:signal transduction histidine kinase